MKKTLNRELVEVRNKVLSQRIDRLYNIFIVLSQDKRHISNLNAIKVIKEQYSKMYNMVVEKEAFDKYEEVENTIIPKLAQIELELDKHIYRTSEEWGELFNSYIKEVEKYDNYNNLDGELEKIKALKELVKLYRPYISQEQHQSLQYKISALKFDILLRKQIKDMPPQILHDMPNLLNQYDTKEEKGIFEALIRERFKDFINSQIIPGMQQKDITKEIQNYTYLIMQNVYVRNMLLRQEIDRELAIHKVERLYVRTTQLLIKNVK